MTLFNDVFTGDAFQFLSLTEGVMNMPYVESELGSMSLFEAGEGVETDMVMIDELDGAIQVLTTRERGAPPERALKEGKAKSRAIKIPHLQFEDRIPAASLFGKRKFGQNVQESVAEKINDRYQRMMNMQIVPTYEVHRLNALRGILLDSDGTSVIHNYFTFFEKTQISVAIPFSVATTPMRETVVGLARRVEDELAGIPFTGLVALCGRTFFDALTKHPTVRDTYLNQEAAQGDVLRKDLRKTGFMFGGVLWKEYRGMRGLANGLGMIPDAEALLVPTGVDGMLRTYYAPGDFLETVGTLGQQFYAKVAPDWKYNRWVDQLMETNPLFINCRPRAVIKLTMS